MEFNVLGILNKAVNGMNKIVGMDDDNPDKISGKEALCMTVAVGGAALLFSSPIGLGVVGLFLGVGLAGNIFDKDDKGDSNSSSPGGNSSTSPSPTHSLDTPPTYERVNPENQPAAGAPAIPQIAPQIPENEAEPTPPVEPQEAVAVPKDDEKDKTAATANAKDNTSTTIPR